MSDRVVSLNAVMAAINDGFLSRAELRRKIMLLSPTEQEMSAVEYEKVKDRMRQSNGTDNAYGLYVRALFEGQIDEAVAIVERWAREHPKENNE